MTYRSDSYLSCEIRRPDPNKPNTQMFYTSISSNQASSISSMLSSFVSKVNAINSKEGEVIALCSVTVVLLVLMAFLSGGTMAGAILLAGLSADSVAGISCLQLGNLCDDALD